jgi:hypothetical protein
MKVRDSTARQGIIAQRKSSRKPKANQDPAAGAFETPWGFAEAPVSKPA